MIASKMHDRVGARLFVYGTLLAGERNHRFLAGARLLAPARTTAAFTLYDLGAFPALVTGGQHAVSGEVYEIDAAMLAAIDGLEGHPNFYRRTPIRLDNDVVVESYLLAPEQVQCRPVIECGSWRARGKELKS